MIITKHLKKLETRRSVLISISIFKMENPYRTFFGYEINLKKFIYECPSFANIRLYVDDSTEYLAERYLHIKHLEIIKYECSEFKISSGHTGTFGTLVRLLPLFDWPSGYDIVWTCDIDLKINLEFHQQFLDDLKNADFSFISNVYYNVPWVNVKYNIVNYKIISKISFPMKIFTDFLTDLKQGGKQEIVKEIVEYDNSRKGSYSKYNFKEDELCPYGIDELFTNSILFNYLKTLNKKVIVYKKLDIMKLLGALYYTDNNVRDVMDKHIVKLKQLQIETWISNTDSKNYDEYLSLTLQIINELEETEAIKDFKMYSRNVRKKSGIYHIISINSKQLI
jgi:hypothetical protein